MLNLPRLGLLILLLYSSLLFLISLVYNPYKSRFPQIKSLIFSGTIIIYQLSLLRIIKLPKQNKLLNNQYGNTAVMLILIIMGIHFLLTFIEIVMGIFFNKEIRKYFKEMFKKEDKTKPL